MDVSPVLDPLVRAALAIVAIVVLVRLVGLRSLSKMSSVDFVTTVAVGSILAGAVTRPGLLTPIVGLVGLFAIIWASAQIRQRSSKLSRLIDNEPILLMHDGRLLDENLARANVTKADVYAKLRQANALQLSQVHAVVMESTGDVSVLHGPAEGRISPELLDGIRR